MFGRTAIVAASTLLLAMGAAQAQDAGLTPTFGSIKLTSGFEPDPYLVEMQAGGDVDVFDLAPGCAGYVADAPDLRVSYAAGENPLTFRAESTEDTTLVVLGPGGEWFCDDDAGGNFNPQIVLEAPASGQYNIWVGAYTPGDFPDTTLSITELAPAPVVALDWTLTPNFGTIDFAANDAPYVFDMVAGGEIDVVATLPECRGYATAAPDLRVNYSAGDLPLVVSVFSDVDTTLIISDAEGNWVCNDDSSGTFNPEFIFEAPISGQYDIWVGTYGGGTADATITLGSTSLGNALDWDLTPAHGQADLIFGFSPDPHTVGIAAGGDVDASSAGEGCWGYVEAAADYRIFYEADGFPLIFGVDSATDTTLIVADPDGNWFCNDDTNGLNPEIAFDTPLSGQYDIWVGTFSQGGTADATLTISEGGSKGADVGGDEIDWSLAPLFGETDLAAGFIPDPNVVELSAGGTLSASTAMVGCYGQVTAAPSYRLFYEAGSFPLYLWVESDRDTTILISDPVGDWYCDDDGGIIPLQPAFGFDAPQSGQYDIWVGTYGGGTADATLYISEIDDQRENGAPVEPASEPPVDEPAVSGAPDMPDEPVFIGDPDDAATGGPDWTLDPAAPPVTLAGGFSPDPTTIAIRAGGPISAFDTVGAQCFGSISVAPAAKLTYTPDAWPLILSVEGDGNDPTLVVRTPEGEWVCDDDGGQGLNPSITFDTPGQGDYAIWVGTFADDFDATLYISEVTGR